MGIKALLDAILGEVSDVWAENAVALPSRRFVSDAPFASYAMDCPESVTVHLETVNRGDPNQPQTLPAGCVSVYSATITVAILRCVHPSIEASDADHDAAAAAVMADVDLSIRFDERIFQATGCRLFGLVSTSLIAPQSATAGMTMVGAVDLIRLGA